MKALWHGCPMVLVPWGRDQPGVAARAAALGVADIVDREAATAATIGAAIDRALGNREMLASAAHHSARLKATDPPAAAATLIEEIV